jgi:hypothetical protein
MPAGWVSDRQPLALDLTGETTRLIPLSPHLCAVLNKKNFFIAVAGQNRRGYHVDVRGPYKYRHVKNMFKAGIINGGTRIMVGVCSWHQLSDQQGRQCHGLSSLFKATGR